MTIRLLKERHIATHPESHFFDRDTLKFFGERISEMRVLKGTCKITDAGGIEHDAYCVSSIQHKAPGGPKRHYFYFDSITYDLVYA